MGIIGRRRVVGWGNGNTGIAQHGTYTVICADVNYAMGCEVANAQIHVSREREVLMTY
jgi:hypothetical protein